MGEYYRWQGKGSGTSAVLQNNEEVFWQWCLVGPNRCTKHRLAGRRERRGGQNLADVLLSATIRLWALVLDETKRLQDCRSSKSYRILRIATRVSTPQLQQNDTEIARQVRQAMLPREVTNLQQ